MRHVGADARGRQRHAGIADLHQRVVAQQAAQPLGINALRSNDEVLGVKKLSLNPGGSGLLPLLKFTGDGSNYDVRCAIE